MRLRDRPKPLEFQLTCNILIFKENFGGERGIRTLEGLLTLTPLAGVRLRPLGHLSAPGNAGVSAHWPAAARLPACGAGHDTEAARVRQSARARARLRRRA